MKEHETRPMSRQTAPAAVGSEIPKAITKKGVVDDLWDGKEKKSSSIFSYFSLVFAHFLMKHWIVLPLQASGVFD